MEKKGINECSYYFEQKFKSHKMIYVPCVLFSITGWLLSHSSTCTMTREG